MTPDVYGVRDGVASKATESLKVIGTRGRDTWLLSFGEFAVIAETGRGGIKFYRKFYCVPSTPLYGAKFLSGQRGGEVFRSHGFGAADTKAGFASFFHVDDRLRPITRDKSFASLSLSLCSTF